MQISVKEAYDTLKAVLADISGIVRSLAQWQTKKLIEKYREGLGAINLICLKVGAEAEVAQRVGKNINLTMEDRKKIVGSIIALSDDLNRIVGSDPMRLLLGYHPQLARKVYLKMYGERDDYLPEDIWSDEEEFLRWIGAIPFYISEIFAELDKIFESSHTR
ncbi:MAG: hypothetical protein ACOZFS_08050 [Thermodesulfobacteriota bacterium]